MSLRTSRLADRVKAFSDEVVAFVEQLSEDDLNIICDWEQWTVGVTAHHIGKGHMGIFEMAGLIVNGEPLPQLDMDQINAMSNQQARENANCTKDETLDYLQKNTAEMIAFIADLSDDDLDRKGSMPAFGGEVTTEQLIEYVVFQSAVSHFENIKNAVAGVTAEPSATAKA